MDYGFIHGGKVYTSNGTTGIDAVTNDERNRAIEAAELAHVATQPARVTVYYDFPAERLPVFGQPRRYREAFAPLLHSYVEKTTPDDPGIANLARVSTWLGTPLGAIVSARVYRHNFGGRFVTLTANIGGTMYHGRASWDHGNVITLRKAKGGR